MSVDIPAWVVYVAAAGAGALGLVALIWGWRWDCARGRSRCPKCWHDMTAQVELASLICPECGCNARSARRLRRTRRNRWVMALGMLIVTASVALTQWPRIKQYGWDAAPTTLLIAMLPTIDGQGSLQATLESRLHVNGGAAWNMDTDDLGLWGWQRTLLARRCAAALDPGRPPPARELALDLLDVLGPEAAPAIDALIPLLQSRDWHTLYRVTNIIEGMGAEARPAAPDLLRLLSKSIDDPTSSEIAREPVIAALGHCGDAAAPAVPTLASLLDTQTVDRWDDPRRPTIIALGELGVVARAALPELAAQVKDKSSPFRLESLQSTWSIDPDSLGSRELLLLAMADSEVGLRTAASEIAQADTTRLAWVVQRMSNTFKQGRDVTERIAAIRGLATLGGSNSNTRAVLEQALSDSDPTVRLLAVHGIRAFPMSSDALAALANIAHNDADAAVRSAAAATVASRDFHTTKEPQP